MAAAIANFTQLTELSLLAQTFADAFEPDLDAWEYIPVALATAEQAA